MRLISSFRTRMFLVTALIVALVLASVMLLAWSSIFEYQVQTLDERLCGEARRLTLTPPPPDRFDGLQTDMANKLHLASTGQLLIRFVGPAGGVRHAGDWPLELDVDKLAWQNSTAGRGSPPVNPPHPPPVAPSGAGPPAPGMPPPPFAEHTPPPLLAERAPPECQLASFTAGDTEWRASRVTTPLTRGFVAADLAATRAELRGALKRAATLALPLGLLLTAVGAWLLSGLALRPALRLRDAMRSVDRNALDQRLPGKNEDNEFRDLIESYNTMLERLEASFNQASRFSADAAHELKTPLTILQGQLERAIPLANNRSIQINLGEMLDEVGRLASISRKLLMLSQADAGKLALVRSRVDFSRMLEDSLADAQMMDLQLSVGGDIQPGLALQGDEQLLAQLVNNIVGNAIKYTPQGGKIAIRGRKVAAGVETVFSNTAPDVGPADRQRFFDRFFRGDSAHNRRIDGHGLGLSLARIIARAHGGDLTLEAESDGVVVLRLTLPLGPREPRADPG
jgi:two-component system, OmpR family, heavy metal sensor histidine kinase CusS